MTDISLHRRLMRKRGITTSQYLALNKDAGISVDTLLQVRNLRKGINIAPEFDRIHQDPFYLGCNEPPSKWQRFCEAWARFKA